MIIESGDDHSRDSQKIFADQRTPIGWFSDASIGIANMQNGTFEDTVDRHPELNPDGRDTDELWRDTQSNGNLSIRAAAFALADLISWTSDRRRGTGEAYSQEQIAAIGYNVGPKMALDIATGHYAFFNDKPLNTSMGPQATNYLDGYNGWWTTADEMICGERVLEC